MKMLDLFSGLGGASEAFVRAGWEVMRIENNPLLSEVPNTEIHIGF
jgi:site-specific DNA-cytosine methylase